MTTDMHKAPSVARDTGTSGDDATFVARYDLSTSESGRRYVSDFFATELRRHDFTDYITTRLAADFACALAQHLAASGKQQVGEVHPDDVAVDAFAVALKAKMADARAKGRGGWEDPAQCTSEDLSRMLRDHVEKGDPRDEANFCMMLHQRGEAIVPHAMQVPDNEIVRQILGRPNFACIELAGALRLRGDEIPRRAESEQAAVLLFLLNSYPELPDRWSDNVRDKLRRIKSQRDAAPGVAS